MNPLEQGFPLTCFGLSAVGKGSNVGVTTKGATANMQCPKCNSSMESVLFHDIEVDRCTKCKGIWFYEFTLDDLKAMKGSEAIDVGDPAVGKQQNKVGRIACPVCGGTGKMLRMVDIKNPQIWFECCHVCGGAYFDAGEFKHLKHETIADYFRNLFHEKRE